MIVASIAVEEALLVLKIAFLVLLYLFIWRIVRTAGRDLRLPQESFILAPGGRRRRSATQARRRGGPARRASRARRSSEGEEFELDSSPLTIGRGAQNDVPLDGDEFASARHARIEPRARRRLGPGPRLDERHLRERRPARRGRASSLTAATSSASARPT